MGLGRIGGFHLLVLGKHNSVYRQDSMCAIHVLVRAGGPSSCDKTNRTLTTPTPNLQSGRVEPGLQGPPRDGGAVPDERASRAQADRVQSGAEEPAVEAADPAAGGVQVVSFYT